MSDPKSLYQEVILDHNRKPRNYGTLEHASHHAKGHNPLCGDRLEVWVQVEDGRTCVEHIAQREARRRGQDLLAELAALQRALLSDAAEGGVPVQQLRRLEQLAAEVPAAADPRLREVMEAITLRVRVELARYRI